MHTQTLTLLVLAACGSPAPTQHPEPNRPSDWWIEKQPAQSPDPLADEPQERHVTPPETRPVPPLERAEAVSEEVGIPAVTVAAVPAGAFGWKITINNTTNGMISVLWDESTFVASDGESLGRLIRGETRRIDAANAQPAAPVAPHASITQVVLVEKTIDVEELEAKYAEHSSRRFANKFVDGIEARRRELAALRIGARLIISIQLSNGKKTWTGRVSGGQ